MKGHPRQGNFSKGELSPLFHGNSNTETYANGVAILRNMYADSRGAAKNRESFRHIFNLIAGNNARVESFNRSFNEYFIFVFVDLKLFFIRNVDNPIISEIVSPWSEDQIDDIYIVPLPDGRIYYMMHPNIATHKLVDDAGALVTSTFTTVGSSNFIVPASVISLSVCVCGGGGGGGQGTLPVNIPNSGNGGGGGGGSGVNRNYNISVTPAEIIPIVVGTGGIGGSGAGNGGAGGTDGTASSFASTSTTITSFGGIGAAAGGNISSLGKSGGGGGGRGGYYNVSPNVVAPEEGITCAAICGGSSNLGGIADKNIAVSFGASGAGGGGGGGGFGKGGKGGERITFVTSDTIGESGIFGGGGGGGRGSSAAAGGNGGSGKVTITYETPTTPLLLVPVSFTAAPVKWANENFPSAGAYFQSRLWIGGTPNEGESFIGSVVGSPEDLTIGVNDADAFAFAIENFGTIQWMAATKLMVIGTENGEYVVNSNSGIVTPTDIQIIQQSSYGSAHIQPIKIGDQVIYVSPDRRKVRSINYEERKQNWMSKDLTFLSEHLTEAKISKIAWAQHPNNLLWVTLGDGSMCCLSYERGDLIDGWHQHNTAGQILSIGSGFDGERSISVLAVIRQNGQIGVEITSDDYYMDSWRIDSTFTPYTNSSSIDMFYVEGFDHIEGNVAQITIDGAVHPFVVVGAESGAGEGDGVLGRVYLEYEGSIATVGLGYTAELETLDADGGSTTGSGKYHMKRWNKIFVDVLNSGLPLINGERGNDRDVDTPMDVPEGIITGTVEAVNLDWDRTARVNIKQDLPLPLVILSIYGELNKNKF